MKKIIVVGAGPSGMMAAYQAAAAGSAVTLFEQNEKAGKKLFITGKGRCNLTNACDTQEVFSQIVRNPKFLYSSIYAFDNAAVMNFFSSRGLALKTERGMRVFPESDHSSDVIRTMLHALGEAGVKICCRTKVTKLVVSGGAVTGVVYRSETEKKSILETADAVILATGGLSYPQTGSDGSGFVLAKAAGHTTTPMRPALVPLLVSDGDCRRMQGLSLKNVKLRIGSGERVWYEDFGEMLFTHEGISGPLVLSASSAIPDDAFTKGLTAWIDLKPALSDAQLDDRLVRDFSQNVNRQFKNALSGLLPAKMIPVVIERSGINPVCRVNEITRQQRKNLASLLRAFPLNVTGTGSFREAIITRGGIKTSQIDPSTLASKLTGGLYLCGEMIDADAYTGGFNLQIAWSTGYLAGISAAYGE